MLTQVVLADGRTQPALHVAAVSSTGSEAVRREWSPALDLRAFDELHLTWRTSRPASAKTNQPLYLAVECYEDATMSGASWVRLLPAARANVWESVELWLGDMPVALRQNVGLIALRPINTSAVFIADVLSLLGVTKQPIADVDAAWLARLHQRFRVEHEGSPLAVPALVDLPEETEAHPTICIVIS
ncbi:MAG TPA: hypothetical protein VFG30_26105, partial [Polyangiales bacterium]|nr:hypothetical protein [Polyangiales bacterium]